MKVRLKFDSKEDAEYVSEFVGSHFVERKKKRVVVEVFNAEQVEELIDIIQDELDVTLKYHFLD